MAKILGLGASLLVSLLLIAGISLVAGDDAPFPEYNTEAPNVDVEPVAQVTTFGGFGGLGKIGKPWFSWWQPSYCAWDYWTTGAFEIVINGAPCSQVTPGWADRSTAGCSQGLICWLVAAGVFLATCMCMCQWSLSVRRWQ